MVKQTPTESVQMSRSARDLIQTHGPRAAAIAIKRAAYLYECGEEAAAETWRSIAAIVREIEAEAARTPAGTTEPD
jgi:hypothetical protein